MRNTENREKNDSWEFVGFEGLHVGVACISLYLFFWGVYFVTNLALAVVYHSFKSELVKQVFEMDRMRRAMLEKAFNLLDTRSTGYLNKDQCIRLFEELNKYRTLPKITKEEFELIFDELDDSRDVKLNKDEFADICHAIALKFQKEDSISYFEYLPFYNSPTSNQLKEFVKRPIFGYLVSFLLVLNLVVVIIETTLDIQNNFGQKVWQVVEFIFGMDIETYDSFIINNNEDLQVLFHCRPQFSDVRTPELLAKFGDVLRVVEHLVQKLISIPAFFNFRLGGHDIAKVTGRAFGFGTKDTQDTDRRSS
nr:two pore calcium channel protein 1-like [Arachis hypogaea]